MNTDAEQIYLKSIQALDQMMSANADEMAGWSEFDYTQINDIPSNLDAYDYCFSIAIGMAGSFISTSKELARYLEEIHKVASESGNNPDFLQKVLGKLLHHKGDTIDQVDATFITRGGDNAYGLFHRLLWGHDILSFKGDNPFYLMVKQTGVRGILQALRHLTADTMSSQGLPIPGSSLLDYTKDNGRTSNYLINLCQGLSEESTGAKNNAEKIYSHMFTIRAQDIMGGAAVGILSKVYYFIRGYEDKIRKAQFDLVAYSVSFFTQAIIGAVKQSGVPYINIPLLCTTLKHLVQLYILSGKETKGLERRTDELVEQGNHLEAMVLETGGMLQIYESADDFIFRMERAEETVDDLVNFFEKE